MKVKHICSYSIIKMTTISLLKNMDLSIERVNIKSAQYNILPNLHIAQGRNFAAASILDAKQKSYYHFN